MKAEHLERALRGATRLLAYLIDTKCDGELRVCLGDLVHDVTVHEECLPNGIYIYTTESRRARSRRDA